MPEMDGIEATTEIRNSEGKNFDPNIPIIALTAHAFEEDKKRCMNAGMNDYLSKPFSKEQLLQVLEKFHPARPPTIVNTPLLNSESPLKRLDGDVDLLMEICDIFINDTPVQINKLRCKHRRRIIAANSP